MKIPNTLAKLAAFAILALPAMAHAGQLDHSFGDNGVAEIPLNGPVVLVARVLQQPNAELLVEAGAGDTAENIRIVRLTADGAVDTTFGVQGVATLSVANKPVETPTDMQPSARLAEGDLLTG